MSNSWQEIGNIPPQELTESRLQMHYAIQFIAAAGAALIERLPDDSHTSLSWNPELEVFMGGTIWAKQPFRVALDPVSLTSIILDAHNDTIATFPLHQKTLVEGLNCLKQEVSQLGADAEAITLISYPPDFPDHAIAHGTPFDIRGEAGRQELTHYYANTHQLLQEIAATVEDASAIRIWPHHFDIATLITLPGNKQGEPMTVGMGLSPGDSSYNEPYWYVSPYPYPKTDNLPPLDGDGFWYTQHWVGAVLPASRVVTNPLQQKQVKSFLKSAFEESRNLLLQDISDLRLQIAD